jgi:hypothetical protein
MPTSRTGLAWGPLLRRLTGSLTDYRGVLRDGEKSSERDPNWQC